MISNLIFIPVNCRLKIFNFKIDSTMHPDEKVIQTHNGRAEGGRRVWWVTDGPPGPREVAGTADVVGGVTAVGGDGAAAPFVGGAFVGGADAPAEGGAAVGGGVVAGGVVTGGSVVGEIVGGTTWAG